jgi:glycosyltransferase involved in cell wall biosynthesis
VIVVPCFNEASRLPRAEFQRFLPAHPDIAILFVDDGSRDDTLAVITSIRDAFPGQASVLQLRPNRGKAEAVRRGILKALEDEPRFVGFWDADLATPLDDVLEFCGHLDRHDATEMLFGSRILLLGRRVERKAGRHYFGRVFATAASMVLALPVYDTQCGAKLFRAGDACREIFGTPFLSRWIFDVEILARLARRHREGRGRPPEDIVVEMPLRQWRDIGESKVRPRDFVRSFVDLFRIYVAYSPSRDSVRSPRAAEAQ